MTDSIPRRSFLSSLLALIPGGVLVASFMPGANLAQVIMTKAARNTKAIDFNSGGNSIPTADLVVLARDRIAHWLESLDGDPPATRKYKENLIAYFRDQVEWGPCCARHVAMEILVDEKVIAPLLAHREPTPS